MDLLTEKEINAKYMTKGQLAEWYELKAFDFSLPQDWLNTMSLRLASKTGQPYDDAYRRLFVLTVWTYDPLYNLTFGGGPLYLSEELKRDMEEIEENF